MINLLLNNLKLTNTNSEKDQIDSHSVASTPTNLFCAQIKTMQLFIISCFYRNHPIFGNFSVFKIIGH